MSHRTHLIAFCLVFAALLPTSCSWVGMNKLPSNWRPQTPPRCTKSFAPPTADVVMGLAVAGAAVGYGTVAADCTSNCELEYLTTGAIAVAALVQWFAATDGFQYASRCRDAHKERRTFKRGY
jgi:hypothetical protein